MSALLNDEFTFDARICPHRSLHFGEQTWWNRVAHWLGLAPLKDWRCRQCGLRMTLEQASAIVGGWKEGLER